MLGRTCTRRLRVAQPYVCRPCLRHQLRPPPARSLAPLDAFRAAPYHSSIALRRDAATALADEPKPEPSPPLTKVVTDGNKKKKQSKKGTKKQGKEDTKQQLIRKCPSDPPSPLASPAVEEGNATIDTQPQAIEKSVIRPMKLTKRQRLKLRKEQRAAKKASEEKNNQTAGSSPEGGEQRPDIGEVLHRASENGVAEVLAEAARNAKTKVKGKTLEQALLRIRKTRSKGREFADTVSAKDVQLTPIDVEQPTIPELSYGLDRVLFNSGVYHLQDARSQVYNFDPYLQEIMPVADFNFDLLKRYITSSQDNTLSDLARDLDKRYVGSTSSMTAVLAHFHFLLSNWRQINLDMLSKGFPEHLATFTRINRLPAAIFLRWKNGAYAIDADKQYDTANVLSMLGRSMEKLLTLPTDEYERYRRGHADQISDEEREVPEAYHYTTQGDMLMRSQLDAQDSRLPGTGMFDLKTRAVVSIRMDIQEWQENTGYQIKSDIGKWESFEREYYDMMRSTMLKYSLQARMGRMDGIFVAYHNIERIFGFQYISLDEMDRALHGTSNMKRHLGDQEFRLSVDLLNKALNMATEKFPETTIRFHFETREAADPFMYIFAEPMPEEEAQKIQDTNKARTEAWERKVLGLEAEEVPEEETLKQSEQEDDTLRVANHPSAPEHQTIDAVSMPELFEIPSEEPVWSSIASQAQPEALEKNILEEPQEAAEEEYAGPLLCLKLYTRNMVNGDYVKRVTNVDEDTDWKVGYQFEEVAPKEAYRRYSECKRRRRVVLEDPALREEDHGEEEKVLSYYQRMLRDISKQGRAWRTQKDKEQKDREKILYQPRDGWAPTKAIESSNPGDALTAEESSVDAYMGWLYGGK